MGNGKMENGKWENEEWEIKNERINLFFSIYCLIWGIWHFSAVIIVLFGQKKKLPSLELKLIDILKDILFVTRLASGSDMINIGRHIRKVLKKISISVSQLSPYWIFLFPILMLETFQRKYLSTFPSPLMKIPWLTSSCKIIKSHMV